MFTNKSRCYKICVIEPQLIVQHLQWLLIICVLVYLSNLHCSTMVIDDFDERIPGNQTRCAPSIAFLDSHLLKNIVIIIVVDTVSLPNRHHHQCCHNHHQSVWFHNHQCQGCHKYLIFDECQPLLFHRPNVQNVWKYCSEDWISYKTADSRRFIERTFLDKVEHIHQKLWTDFTFSFFPNRTWIPITYFLIVFIFLFWHDDGYHMKEKSLEEYKEYSEHYDVILTALIFVSNNAMELPSSWWKREVHCNSPLFLLYLVYTSTTVRNVNKCRVEMRNLEVRQRCSPAPLKK